MEIHIETVASIHRFVLNMLVDPIEYWKSFIKKHTIEIN